MKRDAQDLESAGILFCCSACTPDNQVITEAYEMQV